MQIERDLQTDTHLSKDFNKVLQSLIIQCNITGYMVDSNPHYDTLMARKAAINMFFMNTFFLFGNINYDGKNLTASLMDKMATVQNKMYTMRYYPQARTRLYFDNVVELCNLIHMMIMYGLQQRKMLVRMSEIEPRGSESLGYWEKKTSFRKGDLEYKKVWNDKKLLTVI